MKMKLNSSIALRATETWSGLDAGRRAQVETPVAGVRHFRFATSASKPAAVSGPQLTLRGERAYLRALRAAEMIAWSASGGDALRLPVTS